MSFANFISQIFSFFRQILGFIPSVFNLLIANNIIRFVLCLVVVFFAIDLLFELLGFPIEIIATKRDKELRDSVKLANKNLVALNNSVNSKDRISAHASYTYYNTGRIKSSSYYVNGFHRRRG